jgi:hypothetical protein
MSNTKFKKINKIRSLTKLEIFCEGCDTIPMEFTFFQKRTKRREPVKAIYECAGCQEKIAAYQTNFTFFNRFSTLKKEKIN